METVEIQAIPFQVYGEGHSPEITPIQIEPLNFAPLAQVGV